MSYFIKDILFYPRYNNISLLLIPLCVILISPFGLTVIKTFVKDEQYKKYLPIGIIPSTVYTLYLTFIMAFGAFFK